MPRAARYPLESILALVRGVLTGLGLRILLTAIRTPSLAVWINLFEDASIFGASFFSICSFPTSLAKPNPSAFFLSFSLDAKFLGAKSFFCAISSANCSLVKRPNLFPSRRFFSILKVDCNFLGLT